MSKLVKLTDQVGDELEKWAKEDGCTLAGEVKALLDIRAGKGVYDGINGRLDKMAEYLDKKFDHLESLIEDTTIDRIDTRMNTRKVDIKMFFPWAGCMQEVYFSFPPSSPIWLPGVHDDWANSDCMDQCKFYIEDEVVWADFYGDKKPQLRLTSELDAFIKNKMKGLNGIL